MEKKKAKMENVQHYSQHPKHVRVPSQSNMQPESRISGSPSKLPFLRPTSCRGQQRLSTQTMCSATRAPRATSSLDVLLMWTAWLLFLQCVPLVQEENVRGPKTTSRPSLCSSPSVYTLFCCCPIAFPSLNLPCHARFALLICPPSSCSQ